MLGEMRGGRQNKKKKGWGGGRRRDGQSRRGVRGVAETCGERRGREGWGGQPAAKIGRAHV